MTITREDAAAGVVASSGRALLRVRDVRKLYPIREGALQRVVGHVRAVDGVSFDVRRGETVGLVGESGCGKTTLGRCIAGLTRPTIGGVYFGMDDDAVARLDAQRRLVVDIVGRPLRIHGEASGAALTERVVELLENVGLGRQHLYRYPHQFSGGQRQRISIARALALDPALIVLDEPTSALDVSVQAQILNLLHKLQQEHGLTYLFITHDLNVIRHMSDRIVVMYLGQIGEVGSAEQLFSDPRHPYTEALLAADPSIDEEGRGVIRLSGTVPDPANPPQGCRFHTRCPAVTPICGWEVDDALTELERRGGGLLEKVSAVRRESPFAAEIAFDDPDAASAAVRELTIAPTPEPLRAALTEVRADGATVHVRFEPVEEVRLEVVDREHSTACVLHTSQGA